MPHGWRAGGRRQEALEPVWQQLQGGTSGLWDVLFLPDIHQMPGSHGLEGLRVTVLWGPWEERLSAGNWGA